MWSKALFAVLSLAPFAGLAAGEQALSPTATVSVTAIGPGVPVATATPAAPIKGTPANFVAGAQVGLRAELARLDGGPLSESLAQSVSRGVKVELLLDPTDFGTRMQGRALAGKGAVVRWWPPAGHPNRRLLADGQRLLRWKAGQDAQRQDGDASSFSGRFEKHWVQGLSALPEQQRLDDDLQALPDPRDKDPRISRRKDPAGE